MRPGTWVRFRLPPDTPWWRLLRRSHERCLLRCLQEALGKGPFLVVKVDKDTPFGETVWVQPEQGGPVDFGERWLEVV